MGGSYLEWPVDVAISAYGDEDLDNADLYVVDWGHTEDAGKMIRINVLTGAVEGSWHNILLPQSNIVISEIKKPISIACFPFSPDSINTKTAIYLTEERCGTIFLFESTSSGDPVWINLNTLDSGNYKRIPGGIGFDDFGRVYIANSAADEIEMYGPNMNYVYATFDSLYPPGGLLNYPTNIVLDSYHDRCEALIFEWYFRDSGLQTYEIREGWSSVKPPLGFPGAGLPKKSGGAPGNLPLTSVLYDAYPNPFNDRCVISFFIPARTHVKVDIFDVLGRRVATIIDKELKAGEHKFNFDAEDISSGVYFYLLKTDNFEQTKSTILLK